MAAEPESLVLQLLRDMRAEMADIRSNISEIRTDLSDIREQMTTKDELNSLRADTASDFIVTRKEFGEQIVGLRRAMIEYHTSVIGHGILISELEGRLRRVEQHLNLADG